MNQLYHWVGFGVVWVVICIAVLTAAYWIAILAWAVIGKINTNKYPWVMWAIYYFRRPFGYWKKREKDLQPPFLYNRPDFRATSKQKIPQIRNLQANVIRYNRRRWLKNA